MKEQVGYTVRARASAPVPSQGNRQQRRPLVQQGHVQQRAWEYADIATCPDPESIYDEWTTNTRPPNSSRPYQTIQRATPNGLVQYHFHAIPRRRTNAVAGTRQPPPLHTDQDEPVFPPVRWRFHPLVYIGLVMLILLLGWIVITGLSQWWAIQQDNWHYGYPRTFQGDAAVGHAPGGALSHFIATNEHGRIKVYESPGSDTSQTKVYIITTLVGDGADLHPVTLQFRDVNHDHKLDMLVLVNGSQYIYLNDNGRFRLATPQDNIGEE